MSLKLNDINLYFYINTYINAYDKLIASCIYLLYESQFSVVQNYFVKFILSSINSSFEHEIDMHFILL